MDVKTVHLSQLTDEAFRLLVDNISARTANNLLLSRETVDNWFMEKYAATYDSNTLSYTFTDYEKYVEFCLTWM